MDKLKKIWKAFGFINGIFARVAYAIGMIFMFCSTACLMGDIDHYSNKRKGLTSAEKISNMLSRIE